MGGGPTTKEESKRRVPAEPDGGSGEGPAQGGSEPDFCELTQKVSFEATDPTAISVGAKVRLLAQHLPQVVVENGIVGFVLEPDASSMRNCIAEGFTMRGSVRSFSRTEGRGELSLAGVNGGR